VNGEETRHIWDGMNMIADVTVDNVVVFIRGINLIRSTEHGWYLFNARGDVVQLLDNNGNVIREYRYDAFGVERFKDENDTNPFRYTGEYFDRETGMIYLRMRFYIPHLGRFLNEDPIRCGLNWYTYVNGNPIMFIDPWGLSAEGWMQYISDMQSGLGSIAQFSDEYWQITGDILGAMRQLERHLGESAFEMSQLLSGRFTFANGSSSTDISMFWNAIFYISSSERAREMLAEILISNIIITVHFTTATLRQIAIYGENINSKPLAERGTIIWNPLMGAEIRQMNHSVPMMSPAIREMVMLGAQRGDVISPAMILAHELGHAVQHINGELSGCRSAIERSNVSNNERVIASQLGEPVRSSHNTRLRPQPVGGPTQWGRMVNGQFVNMSTRQ